MDTKNRAMRTNLLAEKLVTRGHQVLWWTSAFSHYTKSWESQKDGITVISPKYRLYHLKGLGYSKHFSIRRYLDHRVIAKKFKFHASTCAKPDLMLVSSPPHDLAYQAVCFAKKHDIPVLVDIRDPWPDSFAQHLPGVWKHFGNALLFFDRRMMKGALCNATGITAVTQSLLQFGLNYANRKQGKLDRVFYNGYRKESETESTLKPELELLIKSMQQHNPFVVLFIGTFSHTHNPEILIECARKLAHHNILFISAGSGEYFQTLKHKKGNLKNVVFPGWVDKCEIEALLEHANIGICPTDFSMNIIPNKALMYLSAGLPVVSSFEGDLKQMLREHDAGFYFAPGDLDALIQRILLLYQTPKRCQEMSENAKRLYQKTFNPELIYSQYAAYLESMNTVLEEHT